MLKILVILAALQVLGLVLRDWYRRRARRAPGADLAQLARTSEVERIRSLMAVAVGSPMLLTFGSVAFLGHRASQSVPGTSTTLSGYFVAFSAAFCLLGTLVWFAGRKRPGRNLALGLFALVYGLMSPFLFFALGAAVNVVVLSPEEVHPMAVVSTRKVLVTTYKRSSTGYRYEAQLTPLKQPSGAPAGAYQISSEQFQRWTTGQPANVHTAVGLLGGPVVTRID